MQTKKVFRPPSGNWGPVALLLVCIVTRTAVAQDPDGETFGFISFAQSRLVVDENGASELTTVQIPLVREVGATGLVLVSVDVTNPSDDFFSPNVVVSFEDGVTMLTAPLILRNDQVPEGNETFIVEITGTLFGAEPGALTTIELVVQANDEPHGAFQFDPLSVSVVVSEPTGGNVTLEIPVLRGPGMFGRVTVDFEVVDAPMGFTDLCPLQGSLVFLNEVNTQTITLTILPDDIPETNETFTLRLSNPQGGATLSDSFTEAQVIILENDTPVRFSQAVTEVSEDDGVVEVTVTRGLLEDGSQVGDLGAQTTVQYTTVAGTATAGSDFTPQSGTLTFPAGVTSQTISIPILADEDPEGDEIFTLVLSNPSSDAVLYMPTSTTVVIQVNDDAGGLVRFASTQPETINEDDGSVARFTIQRTVGTFSELIVEWQITDNTGINLASEDFQPARGNITIPDGQTEVVLEIQAFDDQEPEVAEIFIVELVGVVSGAGQLDQQGVRVVTLFVADSDDIYGLVEWADDTLLEVTATSPRQLHLAIARGGSSNGIISVEYTIVYLPLGTSDPAEGDPSVVTMATGAEQLQGGQTLVEFDVEIRNEAFLEARTNFYVSLNNTALVGGATPLLTPTISPRIGPRSSAMIQVLSTAANGFISFDPASLDTRAEEPQSTQAPVQLTVTRSGAFGEATVTWMISGVDPISPDISTTSGVVTITDGSTSTVIETFVLPDDLPEVDEAFTVTLVTVSQPNQRILTEQSQATLTILQNDNAAGVFFINDTTRGPFLVEEATSEILQIIIQREGGALTSENIQYQTLPTNGQFDFIGGFGLATFATNQRQFMVTLLPNNDNIPETNETFTFEISPVGGDSDLLGEPTSVMITILANDDFAGVFLFDASSLSVAIDEPQNNDTSVAVFTIRRDAGTFTSVTVSWEVTTENAATDVTPTSGTVIFQEGEQFTLLQISALPDELPEGDESFTVELTSVSGDGRLATQSTQATLTIRQNDDPISFNGSFVEAVEGETAVLRVSRGGQANDIATVTFRVQYDSALSNDVALSPGGGVLVFGVGEREALILVTIIDDDVPEESETLRVEILETTGDAVTIPPREATLTIQPSDDPNGVFEFAPDSRTSVLVEGDIAQLYINRLQGTFGSVTLQWIVYQVNTTSGERSQTTTEDVSPATNTVTFTEGVNSSVIWFEIVDDVIPELEETFEVELSIAAESLNGARLGSTSIATISVAASDDPYGLFRVATGSREVEIAEDVPADQPELGTVTIIVERAFGTLGNVQVTWEVIPRNDDPPPPPFVDLLFFGTVGSGVSPAQSRNGTGTRAFQFSGAADSIVSVPSQHQPEDISDGFTISLWFLPAAGSSGVLVAKTTTGGSTPFYSLALLADGDNYIIELTYLPASLSTPDSVEVSIPQAFLIDGSWHSLTVAVGNGTASFFVDGVPIISRTLVETSVQEGEGELTVGGLPDGSMGYSGLLQDVRIYPAALSPGQVEAIGIDLAGTAITPISGYLDFPEGVTEDVIFLLSLDDPLPEPSQFLSVQLSNSNRGSRIDRERSTAYLTVLKSDAGNGIFGFDPASLSRNTTEPGSVTLTVIREGGDFETVFVNWEIRQVVGGSLGDVATGDFRPASDQLEFPPGETELQLLIEVIDELEPELSEDFVVTLVSVFAADNQTSSTPTSGASIDPDLSSANLTIFENDFPYGLLQFVSSRPSPGEPILPAASTPEIFVEESDGEIVMYVVRAQGDLGTVSVEYFTEDGTATSTGVNPDFISSVNALTFTPGSPVQNFTLSLLDDSIPELEKVFFVNLTNPAGDQGVPALGIGSSIVVHILPSDDAFGVFGFDSTSLSQVVEEGTEVRLTILRSGGTFGNVQLYWEVEGPAGDITPSGGVVQFAEGETTGEIVVTVADDLDPELHEVFNIRLVNVSGGATLSTSGNTVSTVTVRANDFPYGLFVFSTEFRPLSVSEGVGSVEVRVTREFGTLGTVTVDFATIPSDDVGTSSVLALAGIDVDGLIENSLIATTGVDYLPVSGSLVFAEGETSQSFSLTIQEDSLPELDEYIFLTLTSVELNESSTPAVDPPAPPPAIGVGNDSLAFMVITENDDARGVIEFSASEVNTAEPSQDFVVLLRTGGSFGEVSVQWEATPITASSSDYTPPGGTVTFLPGITTLTLPLTITDDNEPEFTEDLRVELLSVSGGARVGGIASTLIHILPSDDPNGALEFAPGSVQVEVSEPEEGDPTTVRLTVRRLGGTVGVIEAVWNITSSDGSPVDSDIAPASGTVQFVSNMGEKDIILSILPDDIPEITETFTVRLVSVVGGARIAENSEAVVQILPNDGPYGVISFDNSVFVAMEGDENSIAMVPVTRSLGTFGDLMLSYSIQAADIATLASADGTPILDYFSAPLPDLTLSSSAILLQPDVSSTTECATFCLSDQACLSFATNGVACQLYLVTMDSDTEAPETTVGFDLYEKDQARVQPFEQAVATVGSDFVSTISRNLTIPAGSNQASIPVTILGDTTPELNESLIVTLDSVDLAEGSVENSATGPLLGTITEATLVILENDDPHGKFFLNASNGESIVRVMEAENFGVSLTIERQGGTIGEVQVSWAVVDGTAVEGEDYAGTGAVLTFPNGASRSTIAITILEDLLPERDEELLIALMNPTGGATVASGDGGTTLVIIEANDNAAGVVSLAPLSRSAVVGEGEQVALTVERRLGALGEVAVDWEISGPGNVTQEFEAASGSAIFEDGANTTEIVIAVRADSTPEVAEPYTLNLISVRTLSPDISPSGWAELDPQGAMATITIRASDNPHGVVEFQSTSQFVTSAETSPTQLTIIREFGSIGDIEVSYMAMAGNTTFLPPDTSLATAGEDFLSVTQTVRLSDGQQSTVITAPIVDDAVAELAEVFLVHLTSVILLDIPGDTIPPSIGSLSVAEITISPSDSPMGEFTFRQEMLLVEEDVGRVDVIVLREQGLVGSVSVVYLITDQGATNGEDFDVTALDELQFSPGESEMVLSITIDNDDLPEVNEEFCVRLSLPGGGAILGNITETCVTILANDDAFGVFSFDQSSLSTMLIEAGQTITDDNIAQLRVIRGGGQFGEVTVPFEVEAAGREDLSPAMGALVFAENEDFRILQLEAVMDTIPEMDETYNISLLPPTSLGRLATTATVATITILANQDPNGVLEILPVDNAAVEEDVGYVEFEVRRTFGTLGEVSVTVETAEGSAVAPTGDSLAFATIQLLETESAKRWYSFVWGGRDFLALAANSSSVLYVWRGVFTAVQTLPEADAFTFFSTENGRGLLVVANAGRPGNREVNSSVYEFAGDEQVQLLQYIPTVGASDVASVRAPNGDWYIVFASSEDSGGNPNVDSPVLRWTGTEFEQTQTLATIGASALEVFTIGDSVYLAAASLTDTRSPVFIWMNGQFRLHQTVDTQQASDVVFFESGQQRYLAIASETAGISLFLWTPGTEEFVPNTTIAAASPIRLETASGYLVVTNSESPGQVFVIGETIYELENTSLPASRHLYPFSVGQETRLLLAIAINNQPGSLEQSFVEELVMTGIMDDFYPRNFTLTFAPGESSHRFTVEVVDDVTPEIDETFTAQLLNPLGGARLGAQSTTLVTILTNDDAHGLIGFSPSSQSVIAQELEIDSAVVLEVVRVGGVFGEVRVSWEVTGEHTEGEVTPTSGEVIFPNGVSSATISLFVRPDVAPELNEVTQVTLTGITQNGVGTGGDQSRGATLIPSQTIAVVTVQANDAPHGVIVWSPMVVMATEEEGVDSMVQLTLIREFGSVGAIIISYSTAMAISLPVDQQAVQGEDFVPTSGSVPMGNGETSATVSITILQDDVAELTETFLVTITDVSLVDEGERQGSASDSPRANPGEESAEVQIVENDNSLGVLSFAESALSVEESAGVVLVPVRRSGGTFGTVGAEFVVTAVTATGGGVDFSPDSGSIQLGIGEDMTEIVVNITNDVDPELDETFIVTLVTPLQGVQLGSPLSATVTILRNDDINGVFSFTQDSLLFLIPESTTPDDEQGVVTLTVERTRNFIGTVTVYWEVSEDGRMDLEPASGNLTFAENVTQQSFQVRAISDGIPELFEAFVVQLVSADGGGRIVDPREARIAIQASDDPSGVIGFDEYPPEGIVIDEGDQLVFRLLRYTGLQGQVTVTWEISPGDTTVFSTISDTVVFTDGQAEATVVVQTLADDRAEVARLFSLQLTSANQARVNLSSSEVDVIVAASDNPHGVVEFAQSGSTETDEVDATIMIPLQRNMGFIGPLRVNFSVTTSTATTPDDFVVSSQYVIIPADSASGSIPVVINNDDIPELQESFTITLDSVELAEDTNGGRDFDFPGDSSLIDQPPALGSNTQLEVRIQENDDPYGTISFTAALYLVNEGDTAAISLTRTGGTIGAVAIQYSFQDGTAVRGEDYSATSTNEILEFSVGQSSANILVTIEDDTVPEVNEHFTISISLSDPSSGANLGAIVMATINIEPSDSPNGVVGFSDADVSGIQLANPSLDEGPVTVTLTVIRFAVDFVLTEVNWRVEGPVSGRELEDIDADTVRGTLTLANGQPSGVIVIMILPSGDPEPEETFIVNITSASNDVSINQSRRAVPITIAQMGMPYGIIGFFGDALQTRFIEEQEVSQTLSLPLSRTVGTFATVSVFFEVESSGSSMDVTPTSGSVTFAAGQAQASLVLTILPDLDPELEETYTVRLTEVTGGASINTLVDTSTFIIRANDAPYGLFGLADPIVTANTAGGTIQRSLGFTITRQLGTTGSVQVDVTTTYDPEPSQEYVTRVTSYNLTDGVNESQVVLPVQEGAFLAPDTSFTVTISTLTLLSDTLAQSGASPEISQLHSSIVAMVTEETSNPLVGFDQQSLQATVNDTAISGDNVVLTVARRGQLGVVLVSWATGLYNPPLVNGSLTPPTGSVQLDAEEESETIRLRATPREPHGEAEVFAVRLSVLSLSQSFPAQVDPAMGTAYIEPHGVVQLAREVYSGVEGQEVVVTVWRRYGSRGDITVTGMAIVAPNNSIPANQEAAVVGTDFRSEPVFTMIQDGVTVGEIRVPLLDNELTEPLKVFYFILTEVELLPIAPDSPSPRLASTNLTAMVTIIDDEGGAGLFQLSLTPDTIVEGSSPLPLIVSRIGGTVGRVTVIVRSEDGRASTPTSEDNTASASAGDYDPIDLELTFEDGDREKVVNIQVQEDDTPELDEYFSVQLLNPPGGSAFIDPNAATLVITIPANDNPGGVFFLTPSTLTLSDTDESGRVGTLTVQRDMGTFGSVTIEWEALSTGGADLSSILETTRAFITFQPGVTSVNITLRVQQDSVAETVQFVVRILSNAEGIAFGRTESTVTVTPRGSSVFRFRADSRNVVTGANIATLTIERDGTQIAAEVTYSTEQPSQQVRVGDITYAPATIRDHFPGISNTINFDLGEAEDQIAITILRTDVEPVAFYVILSTPSDSLNSVDPVNYRATVVIYPSGTLNSLYSIYFSALAATTFSELEAVTSTLFSSQLQQGLVTGRDRDQADTTRFIINTVVSNATRLNAASSRRKRYTDVLRENLLNIFQYIIGNETFRGRSLFAQSMQSFAYSLLEGSACPPENDNTSVTVVTLSRDSSFYLQALRLRLPALSSRRFSSTEGGDSDFLQLPASISTNTPESQCLDVAYIEFFQDTLYSEPTLNSKVLSIGIDGATIAQPLTYRIHSSYPILPASNHCIQWQYPTSGAGEGSWMSLETQEREICNEKLSVVVQKDYAECELNRFGDFAVIFLEDEYGWTLPTPLSCAFVMIVMVLVIVLHLVYFQRTQLATKILVNLCIAIFFFQMMAMVDAFASCPASEGGCIALGLLLHITILAQFVWILAMAIALWVNFMGFTDGREPLIIYIIVCWGTCVMIVVGTILIGLFPAGLSFEELYGLTGDICFMPQLTASLLSTALPVILAILGTVALLSHSCVYWSRWEDFHNMYHDSFNKTEIPLLLVFFALVFLTWLVGGIHMYLREVYTFAIFITLNTIQGVYALVVYFFMSWHTLTRKHKKYGIGDEVEPLTVPGEPDYLGSFSTLASSRQRLVPEDEWDEDSTIPAVIPLAVRRVGSEPSIPPSLDEADGGEEGDSHLDDLMFMLKTQSYPHDETELLFESDSSIRKPSGSEHLQMRRISIADTHL